MSIESKRDVEASPTKPKDRAGRGPGELDPLTIRNVSFDVAREIGCDPRSVVKVIHGEQVRGVVGARIAAALRKRRVHPSTPTRKQAAEAPGPEAA